jgi:hypothetical protein
LGGADGYDAAETEHGAAAPPGAAKKLRRRLPDATMRGDVHKRRRGVPYQLVRLLDCFTTTRKRRRRGINVSGGKLGLGFRRLVVWTKAAATARVGGFRGVRRGFK